MNGRPKWVVTSAWPFVNNVPHLGTVLHLLCADIYTRQLRLRGYDAISVTGSDCHGTPIEIAAEREGVSPREFVESNHAAVVDLLAKWHIEFDNYTLTASPFHHSFIQDFYKRCNEKGYIFKKREKSTYCPKCDRFLPDRYVEGICPYCGEPGARGDQCDSPRCGKPLTPTELLDPYCVICRTAPIQRDTTHWYFNFTAFSDRLRESIQSNPHISGNARQFSLSILDSEEGLQPRAITRDLKWGIPAEPTLGPEAKDKVFYVWSENVLGYVSASAEWSARKSSPDLWKEYWLDQSTRTVFFIGKDNIFFHTLLFPALLLGTEETYGKPFVLPYSVPATEFLLFGELEEKFSKSRGIGIWIDEAAEILHPDYWRYYLAAARPELRDALFKWEELERLVNELSDVYGNFVHRVFTLVHRYAEGRVPPSHELAEEDKQFIADLCGVVPEVEAAFDAFEFRLAVSKIAEFGRKANTYLSNKAPWHAIENNRADVETTLNLCVQAVRAILLLLAPFTPSASEIGWKALGEEGSVHIANWASVADLCVEPGRVLGQTEPLFQKVEHGKLEKDLLEHRDRKMEHDSRVKERPTSVHPPLIRETVALSEFKKLDIRVARVLSAEAVPKANKLVKLTIDLGSEQRQIVAGLAEHYDPEDLKGRTIIVAANLEPATIRGVRSEGMLLAAIDGEAVVLLTTAKSEVSPGAKIS
jgi:methionyl-tRNA synthetase